MGPGHMMQSVELQELPSSLRGQRPGTNENTSISSRVIDEDFGRLLALRHSQGPDVVPPPEDAADALQKWNSPRSNTGRIAAVFWSLMVMGANDASYGVSSPYFDTIQIERPSLTRRTLQAIIPHVRSLKIIVRLSSGFAFH